MVIVIIIFLVVILGVILLVKPFIKGKIIGLKYQNIDVKNKWSYKKTKKYIQKGVTEDAKKDRLLIALAQPFRRVFIDSDTNKINLANFEFGKISETNLRNLRNAIDRDFGIKDKITLINAEVEFEKSCTELINGISSSGILVNSDIGDESNNFFSLPYKLMYIYGEEIGTGQKQIKKIKDFNEKHNLGLNGGEGFRIAILTYIFTSSYELGFINKSELYKYMDPLIVNANSIFNSWNVYGESFMIGEYCTGLNSAISRKVISSIIINLEKDNYSPWKYTKLGSQI